MEYLAGTVYERDQDYFQVQIERVNGRELAEDKNSIFIFNVPGHTFHVGEKVMIVIDKVEDLSGHSDNG